MSNIVSFPPGGFRTGGGDPEDPMLERRVATLEDDVKDIKSSLHAIEITLAKIEGRLTGIEARFNSLPTVWAMLALIFTTWGIGSGILIFALNVLKK